MYYIRIKEERKENNSCMLLGNRDSWTEIDIYTYVNKTPSCTFVERKFQL